MSDGLIAVFLYRYSWDEGERYYGESRQIRTATSKDILGVATRPSGETITGAESFDEFAARVRETANDIRWFDKIPLETKVPNDE